MTVARKYLSAWTGRLLTRFMIMTNDIPALSDDSNALAGRLVIMIFKTSFYETAKGVGRSARLLEELPEHSQLVEWKGFDRLKERGHFVAACR